MSSERMKMKLGFSAASAVAVRAERMSGMRRFMNFGGVSLGQMRRNCERVLEIRQQRLNQIGRHRDGGVPFGFLAILLVLPKMLNPALQVECRFLHGHGALVTRVKTMAGGVCPSGVVSALESRRDGQKVAGGANPRMVHAPKSSCPEGAPEADAMSVPVRGGLRAVTVSGAPSGRGRGGRR